VGLSALIRRKKGKVHDVPLRYLAEAHHVEIPLSRRFRRIWSIKPDHPIHFPVPRSRPFE
jgi:hypothetical protein